MKLGERGEALIKGFEKLALTAYQDSGGVWTIGWGCTRHAVEGATCTTAQAEAWFVEDVQVAVSAVLRTVDIQLSQNQFDALVAFTYNVGAGNEAHSTLLKLVNVAKFAEAAAEFGKWNHIHGAISSGLTKRRAAERELFLSVVPAPAPR